jgi:hypothetical protein
MPQEQLTAHAIPLEPSTVHHDLLHQKWIRPVLGDVDPSQGTVRHHDFHEVA